MEKGRYNELSATILDAAMSVHKLMGPGLLESVYQHCMSRELSLRNIPFEAFRPVPLIYKGFHLEKFYVIDLLIDREIILELKAVEYVMPIHEAQIISYLKLADKRLGFLINFNETLIKDGFRRFVNGF